MLRHPFPSSHSNFTKLHIYSIYITARNSFLARITCLELRICFENTLQYSILIRCVVNARRCNSIWDDCESTKPFLSMRCTFILITFTMDKPVATSICSSCKKMQFMALNAMCSSKHKREIYASVIVQILHTIKTSPIMWRN